MHRESATSCSVTSRFFTMLRTKDFKYPLSSSPPSSLDITAFWSCRFTSATLISEILAFYGEHDHRMQHSSCESSRRSSSRRSARRRDRCRLPTDYANGNDVTVIRSGAFEKMDAAETSASIVPTIPRTKPMGTDRLSRNDFFASRLEYRMCPGDETRENRRNHSRCPIEGCPWSDTFLRRPCSAES